MREKAFWLNYLVVKPNWIAQVRTVFRRCGGLHSNFVCCHISDINIFNSFGFFMLSARTDLLVRREIVLILSRSFKLFICRDSLKKHYFLDLNALLTLKYSLDIHCVLCQCSLDTCILKLLMLLRFRRIQLETSDFPERRKANNLVKDWRNHC